MVEKLFCDRQIIFAEERERILRRSNTFIIPNNKRTQQLIIITIFTKYSSL